MQQQNKSFYGVISLGIMFIFIIGILLLGGMFGILKAEDDQPGGFMKRLDELEKAFMRLETENRS